eukprot:TRINITY_DN66061_c7_g4_i2.p1 TRINITY_DN66061_c7_g4~~TRINITY_DN66061_c7_g4_i2.p1  ORF type:complete len:434 (-),score=256.01 TRINITY_DN66061_c7_g4_i2:999-2300(-)
MRQATLGGSADTTSKLCKHSVSAVALVPTVCLALSRDSLAKYLRLHPEKRGTVQMCLGEGMEGSLGHLSFMQGMSLPKLHRLALMFRFRALSEGEILFAEWQFDEQDGNPLYFLYRGQVDVCVRDRSGQQKVVSQLKEGEFFGEVGMVVHMPRTATIRARTQCLLLELRAADFHNFLQLAPEALDNFKAKLRQYSISLRHLMHSSLALQYFTKHLECEYAVENIMFWRAVKEFREEYDAADPGDDYMVEGAEAIVGEYVADSAPHQVNLPATIKKELLQAVLTRRVTKHIFEEAEEAVLDLMDRDSFKRFKSSALFQEFVNNINFRGAAGKAPTSYAAPPSSVGMSSEFELRQQVSLEQQQMHQRQQQLQQQQQQQQLQHQLLREHQELRDHPSHVPNTVVTPERVSRLAVDTGESRDPSMVESHIPTSTIVN